MISKRMIKARIHNKTKPDLVETIRIATKNPAWIKVAQKLSGSTRKYSSMNLSEIDEKTKEGDTIILLGKLLASGDLTKKVRICALSVSKSAEEKIKKNKSEYVSILDEIKQNPKAQGVKIIQ